MAKIIGSMNQARRAMANKKIGALDVVGVAGTAYSGVAEYNEARREGDGVLVSGIKGVSEALLIDIIGWPTYLGAIGAKGVAYAGKAAFDTGTERAKEINQMGTGMPFASSTFVDTEQTYTMRQAGLTQMQNSMMNTKKAVMGNEAMYMHQ